MKNKKTRRRKKKKNFARDSFAHIHFNPIVLHDKTPGLYTLQVGLPKWPCIFIFFLTAQTNVVHNIWDMFAHKKRWFSPQRWPFWEMSPHQANLHVHRPPLEYSFFCTHSTWAYWLQFKGYCCVLAASWGILFWSSNYLCWRSTFLTMCIYPVVSFSPKRSHKD